MSIESFDRLSVTVLVISLGFSALVAVTQWKWFPTPGDWGHIAEIPPDLLNYVALLLPWTVLLACLIVRRRCFGENP